METSELLSSILSLAKMFQPAKYYYSSLPHPPKFKSQESGVGVQLLMHYLTPEYHINEQFPPSITCLICVSQGFALIG